ncbi:hypothetical protein [Vibrio owensii]|uniref:hypothetical protein n=1 Tax=Vibrio harveyi group TaxID=717610 RepID=UPI003CC62782
MKRLSEAHQDFKDELAYIINCKITSSSLSLRRIAASIDGVTPALLSRVGNYTLDSITTDRLIKLICQLDLLFEGKVYGFDLNRNPESKVLTLTYQGRVSSP